MAVELPFSNIITLILTLLVIAVVGIGSYYIFAQKTAELAKVDFQSLPQSTKTAIQANSELLIDNLEKCLANNNSNCRCANMLVKYPKEVTITMTNKGASGTEFDFLYNKKSYFKKTIGKMFLSSVRNDGDKIVEQESRLTHTMTFDKFPLLDGQKIISNDIYKLSETRAAFITYKAKTAIFIGKSEKEQIEFFNKLPAC